MRLHRRAQPGQRLEAEPVHPGVEMQSAGTDPTPTRGEGGPARQFLFATDHGREAMLCIVRWVGPALEAVEHVDRRFRRQRLARREPLIEVGDEEDARARGPQRRRSFGEPDPVSIGLDDGGATPRRRATRQFAPVVSKRAKVDPKTHRRAHGNHDVIHRRIFSITAVVGPSNPGCASTSRRAKPQCSNRRSFSGNSSRVLSVMRLQRSALALASQAAISDRAIPRPRARGATETRATWSASPLMLQSAIAMSAPPSKAPKPPPAAILAAINCPVSRRADDGGLVGRLWAAKAVRMTSAALSASASVRERRTSWGAASASLAIGSRICMARRIRPSQGWKARAATFPNAGEPHGRSLTPLSV